MINYRGTPLFGEDSSVSHTSEFFALAGTVLFWLLFLIFSFVIKPQPKKPEYKEVQIVLSSTPVVQKSEEAPAPAEAASASAAAASAESQPAQTQPVVESAPAAAVEKPVPKTPKKADAAKTQPSSQRTVADEPIQYAFDMTSGVDFNKIQKSTKVDTSVFESMEKDENNVRNNYSDRKTVNNQSTIDGTSGTAASDNSKIVKSENQQNFKNEDAKHSSEIGKVRDTKEIGNSAIGSGKSQKKSAGKDQDSVVWTDGSGARTYYDLDTDLSLKAKRSMQVSKDTPFTITFSVDPDGNVMSTTIEIKNEFILSDIIKKEMKEKISSWKFGKGSGISKAQFDWILRPGN